ncbi:hypothetical protein K466DRAFT_605535 [Polyporus arcularius HHB13444]|uniref:Uncharacterized protein n=1 Tax=Polyporus arcularius HHB13444 TaxID=1314778 RepID=A0A5C3P372_9APHY|nr:hypothetical protein K466DRAFT_605535 [Polyporus arcularius HHB13444]
MSPPTAKIANNDAQTSPPGLRTPGGARIFVEATPTPQNVAATTNDALAALNPGSPLVIDDTFESIDYVDPADLRRSLSPPPLTQRSQIDLRLDVVEGPGAFGRTGPLGEFMEDASPVYAHPSAQDAFQASGPASYMSHSLVLTPSSDGDQQANEERGAREPMVLDWSGTSPESSVDAGSPSPTVRAALRRSQATTGGPGMNTPAPDRTRTLRQTPAGRAQNGGDAADVGDKASDAGTDYFAYFSSPPAYDPAHYLEHTLQGATTVEENWQAAAEAPTSHNGGHGPDIPDGDLRALVLGEQQHDLSTFEHSRNPRKRLWTGSPNPEGVQRGLRRARPAQATPNLANARRLDGTELEERNPWESARRTQAGIVGDNNVNFLGLAFNPVSASTPSLPARAVLSSLHMSKSITPREPPAPVSRPASSHAHNTLPN